MRKLPIRLRLKAYVKLLMSLGVIRLGIALVVMQFFAGWGAILFSFFGTFFLLTALENNIGTRLL